MVEDQERSERRGRHAWPASRDAPEAGEHGKCAEPVTPAQVEGGRPAPGLEQELDPGDSAPEEVGPDHLVERPALQMLSLDGRIENDVRARRGKPHPELDVLDRRFGESLLVEPADPLEGVPANRADPAPEGRRRPGRRLVDVVVEQVSEDGDDTLRVGAVVVGAEERREPWIGREGATDPAERVRVDLDVGVDEYEHVPGRVASASVPGRRRVRFDPPRGRR